MNERLEHPTLFFDGVCNLCNSTVDFVMRKDHRHVFRFGSLQGETARRLAPEFAMSDDLSTVVLVTDRGVFTRSCAIGHVLKGLGGFWSFLGSFILLIPRPIRDWGYRLVARMRYKLWGKRDTCRLPTPAERELFLP